MGRVVPASALSAVAGGHCRCREYVRFAEQQVSFRVPVM